MKKFQKQAAQGDVLITRIDALPDDVAEAKPENGQFIVGHSETGHHHAVAERGVQMFRGDNPLVMFLVVTEPTALEHHRAWDTHEALEVTPGTYEVRNQREYSPEGWRRVAD